MTLLPLAVHPSLSQATICVERERAADTPDAREMEEELFPSSPQTRSTASQEEQKYSRHQLQVSSHHLQYRNCGEISKPSQCFTQSHRALLQASSRSGLPCAQNSPVARVPSPPVHLSLSSRRHTLVSRVTHHTEPLAVTRRSIGKSWQALILRLPATQSSNP